jgi:hypothetical protein
MTKFNRTSSEPYTVITPLSPLSELEDFLKINIFALGTVLCRSNAHTEQYSIVTDQHRKFVLAVATAQDLGNFVKRRGIFHQS